MSDINQVLSEMGFTSHRSVDGFYYHRRFDDVWNFRGKSLEEIIVDIHSTAEAKGKAQAKKDMLRKCKDFIESFGGKT